MSYNIIVIDDERTLITSKSNDLDLFTIFYFTNSLDAILYLTAFREAKVTIDQLWLDHDLGDKDTIRPVVDLLESWWFRGEGEPLHINSIYIHSANPVGRKYIETAINRLGVPIYLVQAADYLMAKAS